MLLALALLTACGGAPQLSGTVLEPASPAPDFTLTDELGQPFTLSEQRGKVVLLFFGFTACPDGVCPAALAEMAAARRQLGADGEQVVLAMVTIDPNHDTPERLGEFVTRFDPSFVGLGGSDAELQPVYDAFGVGAVRVDDSNAPLGYNYIHSGATYVIDRAGRWRALIGHTTSMEDVVSDVRFLVHEQIS